MKIALGSLALDHAGGPVEGVEHEVARIGVVAQGCGHGLAVERQELELAGSGVWRLEDLRHDASHRKGEFEQIGGPLGFEMAGDLAEESGEFFELILGQRDHRIACGACGLA